MHKEQKLNDSFSQSYVIGWSLEDDILLDTSSGGAFRTFAEYVISENGWVYGTEFTREKLAHVSGYNDDRHKRFSGSKYVKSSTGKVYKEIKERLESGETVLFGGTPCQCDGLRCFLKRDYENLYIIDIICHGSPRPQIFEKYLQYLENKYKSEVVDVKFRNKDKGWKNGQIVISFKNGKEIRELFHPRKNMYANIFYSNIALMPGCSGCKYNSLQRVGDITLGDFWGYKSNPQIDINEKGTSVMLVNSKKGQELIVKCKECMAMKVVEREIAIANNPPLYEHTKINRFTNSFCKAVENDKFIFAYYFYLVFVRYALKPIKIVKRIMKL